MNKKEGRLTDQLHEEKNTRVVIEQQATAQLEIEKNARLRAEEILQEKLREYEAKMSGDRTQWEQNAYIGAAQLEAEREARLEMQQQLQADKNAANNERESWERKLREEQKREHEKMERAANEERAAHMAELSGKKAAFESERLACVQLEQQHQFVEAERDAQKVELDGKRAAWEAEVRARQEMEENQKQWDTEKTELQIERLRYQEKINQMQATSDDVFADALERTNMDLD